MNLPEFLLPFDIQEERNIILETFAQKYPDYAPLVGDDISVLMDCFMYRMNRYINYINYTIAQNYLEFSSGEYLNKLVALAGIERFCGTPFLATLKITANSPLTLPKGTKFIDKKGHSAFLTQEVFVQDALEVVVELEEGLQGDFDINALEIPNIYVKSIEKLTAFTQESTQESDEALKKRFLLSLAKPSSAGSMKSYEYYSSIPEVAKSKIKHQDLGVVAVIYQAKTEDARKRLQESLEDKIPLTDTIIYKEAKEVRLNLVITLTLKDNSKNSQIISAVHSNVASLFASLGIEEAITTSKIIASGFVDTLVVDVTVEGMQELGEESIYVLEHLAIQTEVGQ